MISSLFLTLIAMCLCVSGDPTLGGGGVVGGHVEGHQGSLGKHGVHGHTHAAQAANRHGSSYGNDDAAKLLYRGEHDKRRQHSDRNRALLRRNRNRLVGDAFRNRGKNDDGFHKVYHKEEFSKNRRFFDKDSDRKLHENFNDYNNFFGDVDGRYYNDGGEAEAAVRASGRYGDIFGRGYYGNGEAAYAGVDLGKHRQAAHGGGYGTAGGGAHSY